MRLPSLPVTCVHLIPPLTILVANVMHRAWLPSLRASRHACQFRSHGAPPLLRRRFASVATTASLPEPGANIHGFTLKRTKHVPELQLTALHFKHDLTGADYLHVARDDDNNVFSIGFKTNPPDATGVPHILEHVTLCGSKKYPVRDPFFKMLPRSLSNFMNAFTSSDHTTYPFATTNAQDFKNLMSVYLDATLNPLLDANDFAQEGWRIGPDNPLATPDTNETESEKKKKLVFKGVVYNEMKGQMSDASYLYYIRWHNYLFPSINNSGGDPQKITDLTYEQLRNFHAAHYHPTNAKVVTYGNLPVDQHAKQINQVFNGFAKIDIDQDIKSPVSLDKTSLTFQAPGPLDPLVPENAQFKTSVTWLTTETSNILESFSLALISSILLDGYTAPMYRALIEEGFGTDWSANTGYDSSGKLGVFSIGLNGVKKEDVFKVEEIIHETLAKVRKEGFSEMKVKGLLHQLEISLKHKTANFGMGLVQRLKPGWFNGVDPFDSLAWQDTVTAFEKAYAIDGYLEGLLEKYFLNRNKLSFTMAPSQDYAQNLVDEEASRLASKIQEAEKDFPSEQAAHQHLEKTELDLLETQEKGRDQDLSSLPTLRVKDIDRQLQRKAIRFSTTGPVKIQWREAPTNGLTYFRAINVLRGLPDELREYIPLFCDAIMRLGTKAQTMEQLEELMKLRTGGINVGYHVASSPVELSGYEEGLSFSGSAFDRNVPHMYDLLRALVCETDFDSATAERDIKQLLQSSAGDAVNVIAGSGHAYARGFAEAGLSPAARLREQVSGLSQVNLTTSLASRPDNASLRDVVDKLKTIQRFAISSQPNLRVAITCGKESSTANEGALQDFLSSLPPTSDNITLSTLAQSFQPQKKTFFPLPYQVYYTGVALPTVPYVSPEGAPLQILAQLLTHKHLHHEIREKGGAYGGGAYSSGLGGVFGFYSYRDPNPENTIRVITDVGRWAASRNWTDENLEEAKLSVFQSLDAPRSVSQEGMTRFVSGVDEDMQQKRREQLIDVSADDVRGVTQKYLVDKFETNHIAVLGEKKTWLGAKEGWQVRDLAVAPSEAQDAGDTSPVAESST